MRILTEEQKAASNLRAKAWREKKMKEDPEGFRAYNAKRAKRLYHENPEISVKQQENFKRAYDENPEFRAKVVRSASTGRYHWTPEQFASKLAEQGGHCALCDNVAGEKRLHIDHDHNCCPTSAKYSRTCGKCNRGILCQACNTRLGYLEATMRDIGIWQSFREIVCHGTWTERALAYLRQYQDLTQETKYVGRTRVGVEMERRPYNVASFC